ncbi:hypothetical protein VP249E411_P0268 [Vibrio phage 249E41-1]|nr:hypothetical protein VP249E411_P0268 [Vibrio phage 249E41-1]CAH9017576.1 hypothetical protein VP193E371_P0267 [Vibrio phage 193E37-1]
MVYLVPFGIDTYQIYTKTFTVPKLTAAER